MSNLLKNDQSEWDQILISMINHKTNGTQWKSVLDKHQDISYEDGSKLIANTYRHAAHGLLDLK